MIEAKNISVAINGRTILNDESICCKPGVITALIGPSGCGKTTLLHCLGLLLPVNKGRVLINKNDVTSYGATARRKFWRDHAAFILQDYGIMEDRKSTRLNSSHVAKS